MDYVHSRPERFRVTLPTKYRSDIEVVESEVVSVVQHWLKKTEEEASQDIKEKMSNSKCPSTHGQNIHGTRDMHLLLLALCSISHLMVDSPQDPHIRPPYHDCKEQQVDVLQGQGAACVRTVSTSPP
ncbi:spermatogenesis-associated protein 19, mitochondrial-like isoform X4 [Tamandua tetradactyla]|uniref:spermatogenesis-associated protein 19, mitochondrial-like isoform X4 n=1 Tax=Tamandua tetradactyla TaxID=48850 RepID=UPI0040541492